ncbi:MAG: NUDIX domain-containing protein [Gammaproteobacteria bacterium]|nr:NUDIX domain-containing protein [Gammaproteobacteria bacterium]
MNKDDIRLIDYRNAYSGYFRIDAYRLSYRRFDGEWSEPQDFELFERGHGVAVLPYDPHTDQLVLIEQFRMGALASGSPWLLEIIAGVVEKDESHEEVAHREAREEANCQLITLEPIAKVYVSPGGSSETTQIYCAKVDSAGLSNGIAGLDEEGENIRVYKVSCNEAMAALASGKVCSAPAVIALQWLQLNKQNLQDRWC